jgi:ferric-dicitrate binding protein FerR (iron transport regulator)
MNTEQKTDTQIPLSGSPSDSLIAEEAAYWLVTLRAQTLSEDDSYRDAATRDAAFFAWIQRSAAHLVLFLEMIEVERRFKRLDAAALACIRESLEDLERSNGQAS